MVNAIRRLLDLQANSVWQDLAKELPKVQGSILDIGCGAQVYRILLSPSVSYLGLDTEDAKAHFGYEVPDTLYFSDNNWPVEDASFDWVLCTEVLEHIPDPSAFLDQIATTLRPGGGLLLTVPFAARWHYIPYDYWRFTPSGLQRLLQQAGFDEITIHARGNPLTVGCYKLMALPLMLLFTADKRHFHKGIKQAAGVLLSPCLLLAAALANFTLNMDWGDDCLGYTVFARRKV
jgi:SAM-dependent methyltransferase